MATQFQVSDVDVKAERRRRRVRVAALGVASVVILVVGGGAAWYFTPPAMPQTVEEATALVQSSRFTRLSKEEKRPYMDSIREQFGSLDRDERRAMMENDEAMRQAMREARGSMMEERAKQWVLMSPEERGAFSMWGNRGGGERGPRPEGAGRPQRPEGEAGQAHQPRREGEAGQTRDPRPEPTDAERAERAERAQRGKDRINDRFANGDAQANQIIGEMFLERRRQREAQGGSSDGPRPK